MKLRFQLSKMLPAQREFFLCKERIHSYVGGFGTGKTHIFLRKALWCHIELKSANGKSKGRVIYPTYDLADELFVQPFMELLDSVGIKYRYNISHHLFTTAYGSIRIFQLQKPARIVGTELTWAGFDEFDVESWKNCHTAFTKIVGRMRGSVNPQVFFVSTPEGTHYMHKIFVTDNENGKRKQFTAWTDDNPYLPEGYLDSLIENYDPKMLEGYRKGKYVNMTSGTVYDQFSEANIRPVQIDPHLPLAVMCDFNRGQKPMSWNIGQIKGDELHIKWALAKKQTNTYQMCEVLESHLRESLKTGAAGRLPRLVFYGDYSGNKETSNSQRTDWDIIEQHFTNISERVIVRVRPTQSVRDGVNAVNRMLVDGTGKHRLFVDPEAKSLIRDFELTVWDASGMREDQSNDDRSHAVSAVRYLVDEEFPLRARIRRV